MWTRLTAFLADRGGNFSMMLAVLIVPVIVAVGMAVDYSMASRERSNLQNALDAAALFSAKQYTDKGKLPTVRELEKFVLANFDKDLRNVKVAVVGDNAVVTGVTRVKSSFMGFGGNDSLDVNVTSAANIGGITEIEVVLVLDNTYSMVADDKIGSLKTVAKSFVDTVLALDTSNTNVRIGLVPFTNHVNVGMSNRSAPWMDVPADTSVTSNQCWMQQDVISSSNCRSETRYYDGVPYQANVCDNVYGNPYQVCKDVTDDVKWTGCVGSRVAPFQFNPSFANRKFPGLMNTDCGAPVTPLTADAATLKTAIDGMNATGETYIQTGVMWGWSVLTPSAPFAGAIKVDGSNKDKVRKVLVLMTDGDNQKSAQLPDPWHWGSNLGEADNWTKDSCFKVRAAGVELYAVTFGKSVSPSGKAVMSSCAGSPNRYYDATNAAALDAAFKDIASKINALRLTM